MKKADTLMKQAVTDNVFPGSVLLVSKKNEVVFFEAYGRANIDTKLPMKRETLFDLASLTKPLAQTACHNTGRNETHPAIQTCAGTNAWRRVASVQKH